MKKFIIRALLALIVIAPVGVFLDFFLPRSSILQVTSTDVRRLDNDNNQVGQTVKIGTETRDVFFINTTVPGTDQVRVFRNEDTNFGWPFYLKFNDSDINAKAAKLAVDKAYAKVTYYGYRIQILSMWPNVVSIERAELGDSTFPWGRLVFFVLVGSLIGYVWWKVRGFVVVLPLLKTPNLTGT